MTWIDALLDKPYARDGLGPEAFNCWALVREGLRLGHGIDVPMVADVAAGWKAADLRAKMAATWATHTRLPRAGDILSMVGARRDLHVALYLDPFRLLHTSQDAGRSRIQRTEDFRFLGFDRFETWRHA